ncbi:MAG: MFS transporter [Paracoccaceae bacterium]
MSPRTLVVAGACVTQFTVIGLLFSFGVLFGALEDEFGWSRTLLASSTSVAFLTMGLLAAVMGRLSDRFGPRPVLAVAGTMFAAGYAGISLVSEPWHLPALFAVFIGVGLASHDVVTLSTVARWFETRRGMMTGVVKTGTAAGQVALPPIAALLVVALGWREAVVVLGAAAAALVLLASLAMSPAPERRTAAGAPAPAPPGLALREARRGRAFWTICALQFLFFPTLITVPVHLVVHGRDLGLDAAAAATLLSVSGGASVAGRLLVGGMIDRIGGRLAYMLCFVPLIAALSAFAVIRTPEPLFLAVAVYGFAHGGFFTVVSPTIAEYFGLGSLGAIFGAVLFFGTIGAAIGPVAAGWTFDVTGAYTLAFLALAAAAAVGLALAASLPAPRALTAPA